jgi:tetratricopeptide (TPR) repeat protein
MATPAVPSRPHATTVLRIAPGARLDIASLRAEVGAALSSGAVDTATFLAQQLVSLAAAAPADHFLFATCEFRRGQPAAAFRALSESGLLASDAADAASASASAIGWDAFLRARLLAAQCCAATEDHVAALDVLGATAETAVEADPARGSFPAQRVPPRAPAPALSSSSSSSSSGWGARASGAGVAAPPDAFALLRSLPALPPLPRQQLQAQASHQRAVSLLARGRRSEAAGWLLQALRYDAKHAAAWRLLCARALLTGAELAAALSSLTLAPDDEWLRLVYAAEAGADAVSALSPPAEAVAAPANAAAGANASIRALTLSRSLPLPASASAAAPRRSSLLLLLARLDSFPGARGLGASPSALAALLRQSYAACAFADTVAAHRRLAARAGPAAAGAAEALCALTVTRRTGELVAAAQQLAAAAPDSALAWFAKGCYAYALGAFDRALPLWQRALAADPAFHAAHVALGHACAALRADADALLHYQLATRAAPAAAVPLLSLGVELLAQGRAQTALDTLQRAVAADPGDPAAWHELACARLAVGDAARALPAAETAAALVGALEEAVAAPGTSAGAGGALDPFWEPVFCTLGAARRRRGDFAGAVAAFEQALLRSGGAAAAARARRGLAVTLLLGGAPAEKVVGVCQAILAVDGGCPVAREVMERALAAVGADAMLIPATE